MITTSYVNLMIKTSALLQKYYSWLNAFIVYISSPLPKENENRILQGRAGFGKRNIIIQQRAACNMQRFSNCFLLWWRRKCQWPTRTEYSFYNGTTYFMVEHTNTRFMARFELKERNIWRKKEWILVKNILWQY